MSRMSDEKFLFMQDSKEKKSTARSARHTRTHCGKGGAVKFPSDYLTEKERKAMNGKCETYRMNSPISWNEFKSWPDEHKITYIKLLRQKYNAPDSALATMFGVSKPVVSVYFKKLGLDSGKAAGGSRRKWNKEAFDIWCGKAVEKPGGNCTENVVDAIETDAVLTKEDIEKITVKDDMDTVGETDHSFNLAVPNSGTLTFEGEADNIMNSIKDILRNRYVRLNVQWTVTDAPDVAPVVTMDTSGLAKASTVIDYALINNQRREQLGTRG